MLSTLPFTLKHVLVWTVKWWLLFLQVTLGLLFRFPKKLLCMCANLLQSCPTLRPHGLSPARLLCPWDSSGKSTGVVAMPSSRGSSRPRDQTRISYVSCIGKQLLYR